MRYARVPSLVVLIVNFSKYYRCRDGEYHDHIKYDKLHRWKLMFGNDIKCSTL